MDINFAGEPSLFQTDFYSGMFRNAGYIELHEPYGNHHKFVLVISLVCILIEKKNKRARNRSVNKTL